MSKIKTIAYYLPQFHPIKENDSWWGKGFTEWTNVGKAKPLFRDHYQPRVPADLGYYDLRLSENRIAQAELAKEAGVYGFCYWHYWFGNGKRLIERPFEEVLESGKPNFPFCLGWANESWKAKNWNTDKTKQDKILIEQTYSGREDYKKHFFDVLPAFKDKRYIKIYDKPVFLIYKPNLLPNKKEFIEYWNILAKENGLKNGIYFIGRADSFEQYNEYISSSFDAITLERIGNSYNRKNKIGKLLIRMTNILLCRPQLTISYKKAMKYFSNEEEDSIRNVYPSIIPNWDHSPRSGKRAILLHKSTPELFKKHVENVVKIVSKKEEEDQIIFLKSWNEWAEGNYLEPDLLFGKEYINALNNGLNGK